MNKSILATFYAYVYLRGYKIWLSYRSQAVVTSATYIVPVFVYYLVGISLGATLSANAGITDYTSFFTIGLAFQGYFMSAIGASSLVLRQEQLYGTLEPLVASSTSITRLVSLISSWTFIQSSINGVVVLIIGWVLGVHYEFGDLTGIAIIVVLFLLASYGLALMSAGVTLITKSTPVSIVIGFVAGLLSGTVYPILALPVWIRPVSYFLPLTWALSGLRDALLLGSPLAGLTTTILVLAGEALCCLILGFLVLDYGYEKAKVTGTLVEY